MKSVCHNKVMLNQYRNMFLIFLFFLINICNGCRWTVMSSIGLSSWSLLSLNFQSKIIYDIKQQVISLDKKKCYTCTNRYNYLINSLKLGQYNNNKFILTRNNGNKGHHDGYGISYNSVSII